ncbi:MAG: thioredoxin fold domain-containing protein [Actinobacteria bacterium]|nr:thioredoxin fold domain-containing protein [Actinomycetota bacterium]
MAEKKRKRRKAWKAGKRLLIASLVFVTCIFLVTLADCGCGEDVEVKENAPAQAAEKSEDAETTDAGFSAAGKTPSQELIEESLRQGKPVFLNFHSNQCIPCIEMEKVIAEVQPDYAGRVSFVVVDVYDEAELPLCDYFQVRVIPTSFFIQTDGVVVDAYEGLIGSDQMRTLLDKLISGEGQASPPS